MNKIFFYIFIFGSSLFVSICQPHIWKEVLYYPKENFYTNFYVGSVLDSDHIVMPYFMKNLNNTNEFVRGVVNSTNGGLTWEHILQNYQIPGTKNFFGPKVIEYVSKNDIYLGCEPNYVVYTNDGGKNWESKQLIIPNLSMFPAIPYVSLLSMHDKNVGIALVDSEAFGVNTHLFSTTDGWKTVKEVKIPTGFYVAQAATSRYNGFIKCLGPNIFLCKILDLKTSKNEFLGKTIDGGENWKIIEDPVNSFIPRDSISARTFVFKDSLTGWCLGHIYPELVYKDTTRGYLSKTTDGGANWKFVEVINMPIDPDTVNRNRNSLYTGFYKNEDSKIQVATPFSSRLDEKGIWTIDSTTEYVFFKKYFIKTRPNAPNIYMFVNGDKIMKDFGEYTPSNIVEFGRAINVSIFPNPSHSRTLLTLDQNLCSGNVQLFNINGELVKRIYFNNEKYLTLDLSELTVGCYNAVINTNLGVSFKKIIVQ